MPSSTQKKPLKDLATSNRTRLGDPISLKAETSDTSPTEHDRGAGDAGGGSDKKEGKKTLKQAAQENPTMLGDPVSLKAEKTSGGDPVDHDNGPGGERGSGKRDSKL